MFVYCDVNFTEVLCCVQVLYLCLVILISSFLENVKINSIVCFRTSVPATDTMLE